jgi:hypothetical protein
VNIIQALSLLDSYSRAAQEIAAGKSKTKALPAFLLILSTIRMYFKAI